MTGIITVLKEAFWFLVIVSVAIVTAVVLGAVGKMMGFVTIFKVIFGFLFTCLLGGIFFYIILDLKPWRKDSLLWDPVNGPGPVILKYKKIAQQEIFNRNTWRHIKSYYMYYGLAMILLALVINV